MARGRKPLPLSLHIARGTWRADRHGPKSEAAAAILTTAPRCPSWLTGEARPLWRRLAVILVNNGTLAATDLTAFAVLCHSWGDYRQLTDEIERIGDTYTDRAGVSRRRPEPAMRSTALEQFVKLATEFGLSPSSRTRLGLPSTPMKAPSLEDKYFGGAS